MGEIAPIILRILRLVAMVFSAFWLIETKELEMTSNSLNCNVVSNVII